MLSTNTNWPTIWAKLTFDWLDWYNNRRLHSALGNMPPEEYERNYYAETNGPINIEAANKTAA